MCGSHEIDADKLPHAFLQRHRPNTIMGVRIVEVPGLQVAILSPELVASLMIADRNIPTVDHVLSIEEPDAPKRSDT